MIRFKKDDGTSYPDLEQHTLKEYLKFKNGLNAPKEKFGTGIKYISVLDILNNTSITYDVIKGLVDIDEDTLKEFSVEYGDVLFQRSSETKIDAGKANVYLDKEKIATFGGFVIRGKKIGEYNPSYMNYLLKSEKIRKQIIRKAQGEQHVNVGQEILETIIVDMPCMEEQQKIADILSSVDDIISISEKEVVNLEEQKKGAMQKIFGQKIRFKDDKGNIYPEWKKQKLGEVGILKNGYAFKSNEYIKNFSEGYYILTIANVSGDKYVSIYDSTNKIKNIPIDIQSHQILSNGDILISLTGNVGRVSINNVENALLNQRVGLFQLTKKVNREFIYQLLSADAFRSKMEGKGQGAAQKNISKSDVEEYLFELPCLEEQQKIADFLSNFDIAIEKARAELECWKEIKKGLLQQLFE